MPDHVNVITNATETEIAHIQHRDWDRFDELAETLRRIYGRWEKGLITDTECRVQTNSICYDFAVGTDCEMGCDLGGCPQ
jgi:hypothetical protein